MIREIANFKLVPRLRIMKKTRSRVRYALKRYHFYANYLSSVRSGSKISRVGRHIFEHKHIKKFFGTNIALAVAMSSFLPHQFNFNAMASDNPVITVNLATDMKTDITTRFPLKQISITQGYHLFHPGIDFDGTTGDPVFPIMKGRVERIEHSLFDYGNSIIIDHLNGYESRYAHLSKILVKMGQTVDPFTKIGEVGTTGHSTGDHLHLEVYESGRTINPLSILNPQSR